MNSKNTVKNTPLYQLHNTCKMQITNQNFRPKKALGNTITRGLYYKQGVITTTTTTTLFYPDRALQLK